MIILNNLLLLPNGMEAVEAQYHEFPLEEYNSNPFIQALPPLIDKESIIKKLISPISFKEEERNMESAYRLHMIHRLYKFFQPLPIHLDIWNTIHTLIYQGYIARNPFDKNYRRYINKTGKQIIKRTFDINNRTDFRTTASCATVIGYSGMGKTSTVNRVTSNIPQVIIHNRYNEQHFQQVQISHLTLQTPSNSSLKALTLQFFMKVDELLDTNTFQKHVSRNLSTDAMLPLMGQVAQNVGIGMLIIDEIQHLQNRGIQQMMNHFVTLMNSFGVPILFIGTPASYSIFQNEFRIARRVSGNGEILWNNMEKNQEFKFFLESIWRYQWNRIFVPLSEEMISVFYEQTQGVSDLIVKLFVNVQEMCISNGKEAFSVAMVKKCAEKQFRLMKPMLEAVKSKNVYKIAQFEDLRKLELSSNGEEMILKREKIQVIQPGVKTITETVIKTPKTKIEQKKGKDRKVISNVGVDIRSVLKKTDSGTPYQLLFENGYIDDMTLWLVGGRK
jgi:hypothetical protein